MNRFFTSILAGAALFAAVGSAHAATISGGTASISNTLTDFNTPLGTLNKFDSSLGTLTAITFTYSYNFNSTITLSAATASTGSVRTESAARFNSSDAAIQAVLNSLINTTGAIIGSQTLSPAAYDIIGTNNIYLLAPGGSQNYTSTGSGSNSVTNMGLSNLTPFVSAGPGTFGVSGETLTGTILQQTGGNANATQTTLANESISIVYTYNAPAVPEPASIALLGAGLLGLGLIRRKA